MPVPAVDWDRLLRERVAALSRNKLGTQVKPRPSSGAPAKMNWSNIAAERRKLGTQTNPTDKLAQYQAAQAPRFQQGMDQYKQAMGGGAAGSGTGAGTGGGSGTGGGPGGTPAAGAPGQVDPNTPNPATKPDNTYDFGDLKIFGNDIVPTSEWYKGRITNAAIPTLYEDSAQVNRQWAQSQGFGKGVEGVLNRFTDPYTAMLLSGRELVPQEYLDFAGGFNQQAIQNNQGERFMDPMAVIQRVFSARGDMPGQTGSGTPKPGDTDSVSTSDPIGMMLYGGMNASDPNAQVIDTGKFLEASLTGLLPRATASSWLAMIESLGRDFIAWKNSAEGLTNPANFGQYVLDRLGPRAGL